MMLRAGGTRLRPAPCRIRSMCGVVGDWNPGDLTGLAATLLPAESRAAGLLWQNTAKTVPATADGDPVRVAVCPYTAVEFTAPSDAARPLLWDEGGGLWSLVGDGVDDRFDFSGPASSPLSVHAKLRVTSSATQSLVSATSGGQKFKVPDNGFMVGGKEGAFNWAASTTAITTGQTRVFGLNYGSTGTAVYWLDGATDGVASADVSAAGFSANLSRVGQSSAGTERFSYRLRGLAIYSVKLTDDAIALLHTYLGAL